MGAEFDLQPPVPSPPHPPEIRGRDEKVQPSTRTTGGANFRAVSAYALVLIAAPQA